MNKGGAIAGRRQECRRSQCAGDSLAFVENPITGFPNIAKEPLILSSAQKPSTLREEFLTAKNTKVTKNSGRTACFSRLSCLSRSLQFNQRFPKPGRCSCDGGVVEMWMRRLRRSSRRLRRTGNDAPFGFPLSPRRRGAAAPCDEGVAATILPRTSLQLHRSGYAHRHRR